MRTIQLTQHQLHNLGKTTFVVGFARSFRILSANRIPVLASHSWVVPYFSHQLPSGIETLFQSTGTRAFESDAKTIVNLFLTTIELGRCSTSQPEDAIGRFRPTRVAKDGGAHQFWLKFVWKLNTVPTGFAFYRCRESELLTVG